MRLDEKRSSRISHTPTTGLLVPALGCQIKRKVISNFERLHAVCSLVRCSFWLNKTWSINSQMRKYRTLVRRRRQEEIESKA